MCSVYFIGFFLLALSVSSYTDGRKLSLSDVVELWRDRNLPPRDIPPKEDAARMARYVVRNSDWCTVTHISNQNETNGFPQARVFSVVDGPVYNSTGIPYIYAPMKDEGVRDLVKDGRCSMTMSLAEGDYCKQQNYDPEDPRCAQVILTGKCTSVPEETEEWRFARDALFSRHPIMAKWPTGHHWLIIKININNIMVVDDFGGNKYPSVSDYFKASPEWNSEDLLRNDIEVNFIE